MRILILDAATYYSNLKTKLGQQVEIVAECEQPEEHNYALYEPTNEKLNWIRQQVNFDVIILGNNVDAGMMKALVLSPEQITKTVVVMGEYSEEKVRPYQGLGITHFSERFKVADEIRKMVGS